MTVNCLWRDTLVAPSAPASTSWDGWRRFADHYHLKRRKPSSHLLWRHESTIAMACWQASHSGRSIGCSRFWMRQREYCTGEPRGTTSRPWSETSFIGFGSHSALRTNSVFLSTRLFMALHRNICVSLSSRCRTTLQRGACARRTVWTLSDRELNG